MDEPLTPDRIKQIVATQLAVPLEVVTPEASFVADLEADSLDTVELAMRFEDETGATINDDDFAKLSTVGELIVFLNRLTA